MEKKCYIIGKVTGLPREQVVSKFEKTEALVKSMNMHPVNPVAIIPEGTPWHEAMKLCIKLLVDCDFVLVLPDHSGSKGSMLELTISRGLQIPEFFGHFKMSEL